MRRNGQFSFLPYIVLIFLCLNVVTGSLFAAPSETPRFEKVDVPVLGRQLVQKFLQDRQGFIWVGTRDGLFRFDGHRTIGFRNSSDDANTLPSNDIRALFEDNKGRFWIGTTNGLARFNPETNDFTTFAPSSGVDQFRHIRDIASDHHDGMWLGTRGGLQHFNPQTGEFQQYIHDPQNPNSLANNSVNAIAIDNDGGIWAGLWLSGLDYLPAGESVFKHYRIDSKAKISSLLNSPRSLLTDRKGRLWIGTEANMVVWQMHTDWSQRKMLPNTAAFNPQRIFSILEDHEGAIWVGSISDGLARWDEERQQFIGYKYRPADPYSLADQDIWTFMQDRQGILWISSISEGLIRMNLSSQGFSRYIPKDLGATLSSSNSVTSITREDETHIWIAGYTGGIYLVDVKTRKIIKTLHADATSKNSLTNDVVYSLYKSADGLLWVGTKTGLYKFNKSTETFQRISFNGGANDYINTISPGHDQTLWLTTGARDNVIHYNPATGAIQRYPHDPNNPNSRSISKTSDVLEDHKGRVWMVGIEGGGLDMLELATGKFKNYRHDSKNDASLADDKATKLHEDSQGNLWVATSSGLSKVTTLPDETLQFRSYGKKNKLPFDSVDLIKSDTVGHIWLSTNAGISKFDPATEKFIHYSVSDGIAGGNTDGLSGAYTDKQGMLYFGSSKGATAIDPSAAKVSLLPPPVAITDITIFNKSLRGNENYGGRVKLEGSLFEPKALTLSWQESIFGIEFVALQFDAPNLIRYAYLLEGFDADWVETDAAHRIATYTNLSPGKYVFRVKAASSKGIWNETGIRLPVTITPAYWQTLWFRVVMISSLVMLLVMAYFGRVRQLKRIQVHLEQEVSERTAQLQLLVEKERQNSTEKSNFLAMLTHELKSPLATIELATGNIQRSENLEINKLSLKHIQTAATDMSVITARCLQADKLEQANSTINVTTFPLEILIHDRRTQGQWLDPDGKTRLQVDIPPQLFITSDELLCRIIVSNLVENALKYSPAQSRVLFSAKYNADQTGIFISVCNEIGKAGKPDAAKVFDKYYRSTNAQRLRGTGLGLWLVRGIASQLDGQVNYIEHNDKVEFQLWLPLLNI